VLAVDAPGIAARDEEKRRRPIDHDPPDLLGRPAPNRSSILSCRLVRLGTWLQSLGASSSRRRRSSNRWLPTLFLRGAIITRQRNHCPDAPQRILFTQPSPPSREQGVETLRRSGCSAPRYGLNAFHSSVSRACLDSVEVLLVWL
jgi:hypothetical protein